MPSPIAQSFLHNAQTALRFPEGMNLGVVVSGDFGVGKTSLLSGLLAAVTGLRRDQMAVVINDLATGGGTPIDFDRFSQLNGIARRAIAACACCDAKSEVVQLIARLFGKSVPQAGTARAGGLSITPTTVQEQPRDLVVIELGGQTNGGQATAALKESLAGAKNVRLAHVTVIDAERFEARRARGELTITELNLENADVVVVTKAGDAVKKTAVAQYLDEILATRPSAQRPCVHYTTEPYLVSQQLWQDIAITPLVAERVPLREGDAAAQLELTRRALVRACVSQQIAPYEALMEKIREALSAARQAGQGEENAIYEVLSGAFADDVFPILESLESSNGLAPNTLAPQIIRIKGELPFPDLGVQFGVDIYPEMGGEREATILVTRRSRITMKDPTIALYTRTGEPVPHWFSGLGIPIEYTRGAAAGVQRAYAAATTDARLRLQHGKEIPLRAEADSCFELLERVFLDAAHKLIRNVTPNPYIQKVKVLGSEELAPASDVIIPNFQKTLTAYIRFRVEVLEAIKVAQKSGACKTSSKVGKTIFALALDLITVQRTHEEWLLRPDLVANDQELAGLIARVAALRCGSYAVVEGLRNADEIRIKGETALTPMTQALIVWALFTGSQENQGSAERHRGYCDTAREALENAIRIATQKGYAGWSADACRKLLMLCSENMKFNS